MKGNILNDGDSIEFKDSTCAWLTCCECGLTHLLMLAYVKKKHVLYVYRDDNLTEEARKELKKKKAKKNKK